MNFIPHGKRVLIKPESKLEKTEAGIIIPESAQEDKPERGTVLAVGECTSVNVNDTILFSRYGFDAFEEDGQEYYVVSETCILGIFT